MVENGNRIKRFFTNSKARTQTGPFKAIPLISPFLGKAKPDNVGFYNF
jgi:hypothetical protein